MSVQKELDRLGERIINDAKAYARPNRKTGTLERSFSYETTLTSEDNFTLVLEEVYYGKFLNNKTEFMDKAIRRNLNRGIDSIIEVQIDDILTSLNNIE